MFFVSVCTGTSFGLRRTGHAGNWSLQRYIRLYENCVYVDGNLEITYLENGSYDLSFLSTIQEVKFAKVLYNVCEFSLMFVIVSLVIRTLLKNLSTKTKSGTLTLVWSSWLEAMGKSVLCTSVYRSSSKVYVGQLQEELLSLIHIWRCRRIERCRSRWSPYH